MNITDVKAVISRQLGVTLGTLDINAQINEDKTVNPDWVSAWIEQPRARISMHMDVFNKIKADRNFSGLAVKAAEVVTPAGKEPYTRFVVITPASIIASF